MKKIKLDIVGLSYSQTQSGAYALVLGEMGGNRRLPIIIGGFEAQAIAVEIEKMQPSRPLTHDLFKTFADNFQINIQEVLIYNLIDGIFFAKLICSNGDKTFDIDSRTSDAVALAVRFGAPIYVYDFIMDAAGIVIESNDFAFLENLEGLPKENTMSSTTPPPTEKEHTPKSPYFNMSDDQLEINLNKAIEAEQYETAAKIRDEIERRKNR
ncbi:bifunctional nuclease family protein [Sphingobacterium sp. DN00404]|uniref:Bifunctional nuclease family protein n=1 Tax=Sphingobacterium micropteri TaxID=2763501 RepID=A0ABR7YNG1_9SPHI|nr:bifunctional nuclease family protein [Sphingobacterium micropteri]MBD1432843.1 bifunctional nuclease family protein [Sphingobacterium micropteri]